MKLILLIVISLSIFSCNTKTKIVYVPINDSSVVKMPHEESEQIEEPCDMAIERSNCMVSNSFAYGYVNSGSVLFDYSEAVKGYRIVVKDCKGNILSTSYCPIGLYKETLDKIYYSLRSQDSLISIIKPSK